MGLLQRASYITALIRMLPFGLIALYFGVNGLINKRTADSLCKIEGEVVYAGIKKFYSEGTYMDAFVIDVVDNRFDTISCHTYGNKYIEKLDAINVHLHDDIVLWVNPDIDNSIKQVVYEGYMLIKYRGNVFLYLFFLIIGGLYTFSTVWYIISHPEHLFKKEEKIEKPARVSTKEKRQEILVSQKQSPNPKIEKEIPFDHYDRCPACGYKLKKVDKECPDCGLNLS